MVAQQESNNVLEQAAPAEQEEGCADSSLFPAAAKAAVYSESGRGERKRLALQKRLKARAPAAGGASPGEVARVAAEAADSIAEAADPAAAPASDKKRVRVGQKMLLSTDGHADLTAAERTRLQSIVGAGKAGKVKAFVNAAGETRVLGAEDVNADDVIMFSGCKQCDYSITTTCVKVFVERCEDFVLRVNGKIITQTLEIDRSEGVNVLAYTKIGTLQVEQCKKVNVMFESRELFCGYMIWAGSFMLQLKVGGDTMRCDFGLTQSVDRTVHIERTQFKVWYDAASKLVCDKVIRLKNGFPSTKKEDDEHTRREEAKLDALSKRMGVTVRRKADTVGARTKPNEPCKCGSGKKFKRCCKDGRVGTEAQQAAAAVCQPCDA
jgi:hypothetical protein